MPISTTGFSQTFAKKWGDTLDTSMRNYADNVAVEIKKRAPFLTGALVMSIYATKRIGRGRMTYEIVSEVPYARRRNYENHLHPQTLHYVENGLKIAQSGGHKRWWKDLPAS